MRVHEAVAGRELDPRQVRFQRSPRVIHVIGGSGPRTGKENRGRTRGGIAVGPGVGLVWDPVESAVGPEAPGNRDQAALRSIKATHIILITGLGIGRRALAR